MYFGYLDVCFQKYKFNTSKISILYCLYKVKYRCLCGFGYVLAVVCLIMCYYVDYACVFIVYLK